MAGVTHFPVSVAVAVSPPATVVSSEMSKEMFFSTSQVFMSLGCAMVPTKCWNKFQNAAVIYNIGHNIKP